MLQIIKDTAKKLEKGNYSVFALQLHRIDAVKGQPKKNKTIYQFTSGCRGSLVPSIFDVRVLDDTTTLTADRLQVKRQGCWIPLETWILEIPIFPCELQTRQAQMSAQWNWWQKNGKHFPLMKLPGELRDLIYLHVLGEVTPRLRDPILPRRISTGSTDRPEPDLHIVADIERVCRFPNAFLLSVSKDVRREATSAGWLRSVKLFLGDIPFVKTMKFHKSIIPSNRWLSQIHFTLPPHKYLEEFGVKWRMYHRNLGNLGNLALESRDLKMAEHLRSIKTLRWLELEFMESSISLDRNLSPWCDVKLIAQSWSLQQRYQDYPERLEEVKTVVFPGLDSASSRSLVDWTMAAAYPYIRHVSKIRISGYADKDMETKWEGFYKMARREWKDFEFDADRIS